MKEHENRIEGGEDVQCADVACKNVEVVLTIKTVGDVANGTELNIVGVYDSSSIVPKLGQQGHEDVSGS